MTAASVFVHLPILIPFLAGYGPAMTWTAKATGAAAYLVIVACAVFRRVDQRVRVWAILGAIYAWAIVGVIAQPQGPYIRAVPLIPPLLAIGLLGVRAARVSTLLSAGVLMFVPQLRSLPSVVHLLGGDPGPARVPTSTVWLAGAALTAELVVLMVLLEGFYGFLQQAVVAQRQSAEERRRLETEIARAGDDERRRLGHEIHDGVCQQLTGALLRCQALELRLKRGAPLPPEELDALSSLLGESIQEARAVAQGLYPLEPTPDALARALRALAKRTRFTSGIACELRAAGDLLVANPTTAQHLYRIAQEALGNAVSHARAGLITVELRGGDDSLLLQVDDDGVGLPETLPAGGLGLRTMSFRAEILDGDLVVGAAPGGGTRVSCRVPRSACTAPERNQRAGLEGGVT